MTDAENEATHWSLRLSDVDLYPPVTGLADLVGSRHDGFALAATGNVDGAVRNTAVHEIPAHTLGASERQRVIVLDSTDTVSVADHGNFRRFPLRDLRE